MRFLSRLKLTIEGHTPLLLSSTVQSNNAVLDVDLVQFEQRFSAEQMTGHYLKVYQCLRTLLRPTPLNSGWLQAARNVSLSN
jgi:hypothetical protein